MNIDRYLKRIGIEKKSDADLSFLARLQNHHLLNVPFENLDIARGIEIFLDYDRFYTKIVENMRGGFCYELNGLFSQLLKKLGYELNICSARVFNKEGKAGEEFDHMVILVELDQTYLVDVGFGDSFRKPISLPEDSVEDVSGRYRLQENPDEKNGYRLQKFVDDAWKTQYRFTSIPRQLSEFEEMCEYHQTSPASHFTQNNLITIATPTGRISLTDDSLTVTSADERDKRPINTPEEFTQMLKDYFGIIFENQPA